MINISNNINKTILHYIYIIYNIIMTKNTYIVICNKEEAVRLILLFERYFTECFLIYQS